MKPTSNQAQTYVFSRLFSHMALRNFNEIYELTENAFDNPHPRVGDLVHVQSIPFDTDIYIAWYEGYEEGNDQFSTAHYLRPVGADWLERWSNIGLKIISRKFINDWPQMRWENEHWEFYRKWMKAVKRVDCYTRLPMLPEIVGDGKDGTIKFRYRYDMTPTRVTVDLPNWRKLTIKRMVEIIEEGRELLDKVNGEK